MNEGKFVISLDFELMWGVRDVFSVAQYGENIKGVHTVMPRLLDCLNTHKVKATFATVGFLFYNTKTELLNAAPSILPGYINQKLSPYNGYLETIKNNYDEDPYHYGAHLIRLIQSQPQHEIGTHTFSHYYCLEEGQTIKAFRADLKAAQKAAASLGISLTSLVFPRNQFNKAYLEVCKEFAIICYRGNEISRLYKERSFEKLGKAMRALRLIDSYINLTGHHCYEERCLKNGFPINLPASRFLRPYSPRMKFFRNLHLIRIKKSMTHAAKNKLLFHLWWHPHNFGIFQDENLAFLEKVLQHYEELHRQYNFQSCTMTGLAKQLLNEG